MCPCLLAGIHELPLGSVCAWRSIEGEVEDQADKDVSDVTCKMHGCYPCSSSTHSCVAAPYLRGCDREVLWPVRLGERKHGLAPLEAGLNKYGLARVVGVMIKHRH